MDWTGNGRNGERLICRLSIWRHDFSPNVDLPDVNQEWSLKIEGVIEPKHCEV